MPKAKVSRTRLYGKILVLALSFSFCFHCIADPLVIRHPGPEDSIDPRQPYFLDLLHLALTKSEHEFGPFELKKITIPMYQSRQLISLSDHLIDIMWSMTSTDREEKASAIYVPLMKGLLGYRVLVINKKDQEKFAAIHSTDELKHLLAYQGHDWPDKDILRHNGFRVKTEVRYMTLFRKLSDGVYDYLPRGLLEAWAETGKLPYPDLMIEENHLIVYPAAAYFFVAKHNDALKQRVEKGLRLAIEDGSFDELFLNHPSHEAAFAEINLNARIVHHLENPLLPESTPVNDSTLWYQH